MPARRRRSWTVLLAAFLLLLPLALSAHVHAGHAGADCAVCVVSHHSPTASTAMPVVNGPAVLPSVLVASVPLAPASADRPAHAGRGPPARLASTRS